MIPTAWSPSCGNDRRLPSRRRSPLRKTARGAPAVHCPILHQVLVCEKNQLRKVGTALGSQQAAVQACKFRDSQLFRARVGGETGAPPPFAPSAPPPSAPGGIHRRLRP